jgi:hypothetical protein
LYYPDLVRVWFAVWGGLCVLLWAGPIMAADRDECLARLDQQGVNYDTVKKRGIDIAVKIEDNKLGGVEYRGFDKKQLIVDCSLAVSLAQAGIILRSNGVVAVVYSSAYQRRNVRRTNRLSKHSFGLAIDVHTFIGDQGDVVKVRDDYEQGLGDFYDCVGEPVTDAGSLLRTIDCRFSQSGLFNLVLSPDFDADHYNHFHFEALPWSQR